MCTDSRKFRSIHRPKIKCVALTKWAQGICCGPTPNTAELAEGSLAVLFFIYQFESESQRRGRREPDGKIGLERGMSTARPQGRSRTSGRKRYERGSRQN